MLNSRQFLNIGCLPSQAFFMCYPFHTPEFQNFITSLMTLADEFKLKVNTCHIAVRYFLDYSDPPRLHRLQVTSSLEEPS